MLSHIQDTTSGRWWQWAYRNLIVFRRVACDKRRVAYKASLAEEYILWIFSFGAAIRKKPRFFVEEKVGSPNDYWHPYQRRIRSGR